MLFDYHVHCELSADCNEPIAAYLLRAKQLGVDEFCFTDHFEYDFPDDSLDFSQPPLGERLPAYSAAKGDAVFKYGVEAGMRTDGDYNKRMQNALSGESWLDFIIASSHLVDGLDPYFPAFFEGRSRQQGFERYLTEVYENIRSMSHFSVVGHIDYPTKGCPYDDKQLRHDDAPEVLDAIFRLIISRGQGIELNTSIYAKLNGARCDVALLKRYRELGGEVITIGSDSHSAQRLGEGFADALEFARTAGLRYVCTFDKLKPVFHRI